MKNTESGFTRQEMGREKFLKHVWKWKEEKRNTILEQLQKLGASLDWDRSYFTLSDSHSNAVNTAFKILFEKGLIYRGDFLVNWSCKLGSAISDIEVDYIAIDKRAKIDVPGYAERVEFGIMYNFASVFSDSTGKCNCQFL